MKLEQSADIILRSNAIFTATANSPRRGFIAIAGDKILEVGDGDGASYRAPRTKVHELGDRTVCPGFTDVHCFFSGYAMRFVGADLTCAESAEDAVEIARIAAFGLPPNKTILGHGLGVFALEHCRAGLLDEAFKGRPAVFFDAEAGACLMNAAAISKFSFTPEACYPEAYWRLIAEILDDRAFIVPVFEKYMKMLNSRGITAVKEMGFDDFYGFDDALADLQETGRLTLHTAFMSQPVGKSMDIEYGRKQKKRFDALKSLSGFSGFNLMTDGSISQLAGDLKLPYRSSPTTRCGISIDYGAIERQVLKADNAGFRFSLHAQGDAAINKAISIFDKCRKDDQGHLINRHAITDVEFSDPSDLVRMGKLGIIAEIYPQIMSLASRADKTRMINEKIGQDRGSYYWNRRKMIESGVTLSCGTDLPLLFPDIPESIFHSCGGLFPEGGEPFNLQNTISVSQLLAAWTKSGAYNLCHEHERGTLESGKRADIVIFDGDLFGDSLEMVRNIPVINTIFGGKFVYTNTDIQDK